MSKKSSHLVGTQFVTTTISTTLVLVMLGTIVLFMLTARNLSNYVRENITVQVLISDDLNNEQISKLQKQFKKAKYVKSIDYVSREDAVKEVSEEMGTDPTEFLACGLRHQEESGCGGRYLSEGFRQVTQREHTEGEHHPAYHSSTLLIHLVCSHQQYGSSHNLLTSLYHQHDEARRSQMEFHPSAFPLERYDARPYCCHSSRHPSLHRILRIGKSRTSY